MIIYVPSGADGKRTAQQKSTNQQQIIVDDEENKDVLWKQKENKSLGNKVLLTSIGLCL